MADEQLSDKEKLEKARDLLGRMQTELARIAEAGLEYGTVLDTVGKYAILSTGTYALNNNYEVGTNVLFYPRTGQVVEDINYSPFVGELFVIDKVTERGAEVKVKGDRRLVAKGKFFYLKEGDVVLLDKHHTIVQFVYEHLKPTTKITNPVTWDQIGGNEEAKQLLREAIEQPHQYPKLYAGYRQKQVPGILMKGPPGCGKTMLGKAAATSVGSHDGGFILIKGAEVLDSYVGVTEAAIRSAFAQARAFKQESGRPAIIFIDEADALLTARGTAHNFMGQTVVPTFLAEMDGVVESGAIVMLSTNNDHTLDPAVIRDGRIDYKVEIQRPGLKEAKEIMAIYMRDKPIHKDHKHDPEGLIEHATAALYEHKLPHSGALLEGCVYKAVNHALRRDIGSNAVRPTGLHKDDFAWATQQIIKQETKRAA